ncbi:hypothetical protein MBLNU230_g8403t1 [Neophaeotheca triangularis]
MATLNIPAILYNQNNPNGSTQPSPHQMKTWLIVGASRGIGLEFVRQLLARGDRVFATVRNTAAQHASSLWAEAGADHGLCQMLSVDVLSEGSINGLVEQLMAVPRLTLDHVVINAGVLQYPNVNFFSLDFRQPSPQNTFHTFDAFAFHLHTNTIGPIITAQRLLASRIPLGSIIFMSSDSGSALNFREHEDGFAAYAASKAALNQMLRHLAAELKRADDDTVVLALHPGEVGTDMANVELGWEVEGIMTPQQSVEGCIRVIESKGIQHSGTFWTWENKPHPW